MSIIERIWSLFFFFFFYWAPYIFAYLQIGIQFGWRTTQKDIIIIIIMSRRLRGYPWPSLAISPYHSSSPAGLQGYIPCPHTAAVCRFVLVVPLLHIHVWGSTGVHRLWARPCFSSSVLRVWFVDGFAVRLICCGPSWNWSDLTSGRSYWQAL